MLFDLRRRGRRRTVQAVYGGLALLMIVGLVGVGVGAGNGNGGILNAFTGGGSGNAQQSVVSNQEKAARKAVKANPSNAGAWALLLQAQWTSAGQGSNYSSTAGFTAPGKSELHGVIDSWGHYSRLATTLDPSIAVLASRAYAGVGDYAGAAGAWEAEAKASPSEPKGYECLAVSAYAAGQARKGDLAAAKALSLLPKAQQTVIKPELAAAKNTKATAQQIAQSC